MSLNDRAHFHRGMSPNGLRQFLAGTTEVEFQACGQDEERYRHIEGILKRFGYRKLGRADKGLVLRYLARTTGYSRQQLTGCEGKDEEAVSVGMRQDTLREARSGAGCRPVSAPWRQPRWFARNRYGDVGQRSCRTDESGAAATFYFQQ